MTKHYITIPEDMRYVLQYTGLLKEKTVLHIKEKLLFNILTFHCNANIILK